MKKLFVFIALFMFLHGNDLEDYINTKKVLQINKNFMTLITKYQKNNKLKTIIGLYSFNSKVSSVLAGYKKEKLQKYFYSLKSKNDIVKLILNINDLTQANKRINNILIIKRLQNESLKIVQNKVKKKSNIKEFYLTLINTLNSEIYIIEKYNLNTDFIVGIESNKNYYILNILKDLRNFIKKDYKNL